MTAAYDVDDDNNTLTGIGVSFHYDSSKLVFTGFSDWFSTSFFAKEETPQDDTVSDFDGDSNTDKFVSIAWTDFGGNWPGVDLPLDIVDLGFTVKADADAGATPVNITFPGGTAVGYTGVTNNSVITVTIPPGVINGTITFDDYIQGTILVGAFSDSDYQNLVKAIDAPLAAPGSYTITDIAPGEYYIGAFNDVDSAGGTEPADTDPRGVYDGAVTVTSGGTVNNIDVTIAPGPTVTGLFDDTAPSQSKTWNWGSDQPNCVFRYLIDQNPTGVPTGEFAAVTTATQSSGTGIYYLHVQAENDNSGIYSSVTTVSAILDNTSPDAPELVSVTSPTNVTPQNISGTKSANSSVLLDDVVIVPIDTLTTWSYSLDLIEGDNDFTLTSKDLAGNESGATLGSIFLDTTNPVDPTIDSADPDINVPTTDTTIDMTWNNGTDVDGSGVEGYSWSIDKTPVSDPGTIINGETLPAQITLGGDGDGDYYIHVRTKDNAGNWTSTYHYGPWQLDTTAPSAPGLTAVTSPTNATPQNISGNKDADSSIWLNGEEVVSVDALTTWNYDLALSEGVNSISLTSKDALGNESDATTGSIVLDTVRPSVAINPVTSPTDLSSQTVTGTRENGAVISAVATTTAMVGTISYPTDTTWSFDVTGLVSSSGNTIRVTAEDAAGNQSNVERTIFYHPAIIVNPSGPVYVPVTVPGYTQSFSITGGSGTFTWELDTTAYGTLASGAGTSNIFTPVQDTPGDAVLTITDTVYTEKSPVLVNIHAVTFGMTPSEGGIVINDTLALQVVGATGTVIWTVNTPATGSLGSFSGTHNGNAVFTGNAVGTTTITVTDGGGGTGAEITSGIFEVVAPITVTPEYTGIADTGTLQFTIAGGKGAGNPANYTLAVDPTTAGTIDATALFTPSDGGGIRTFKITATDKTYTGISGQSVTVTVVDPITIDPASTVVFESAGDAYTFTATGGSAATYVWTSSNSAAGTVDGATGEFTPAVVTGTSELTTIRATDPSFDNIYNEVDVTVYSKVTITNKPEEPPLIAPGEDSEEFTVAGGDDTAYAWSVVGPDGYSDDDEGTGYTFTAPSEGAFAGEYTITVTDGQGFIDYFTVLVPMVLDPNYYTLLEGNGIYINILGAPGDAGFTFTAYDLNGNEVVFSQEGGDVTGWGQMTLDGNVLAYRADDIEVGDEIAFTLEVIAEDEDLMALDLDLVESGTYRVIPIGTYAGVIRDAVTNEPINGAYVRLIAPKPEFGVGVGSEKVTLDDPYLKISGSAGPDGAFEFELPATGAIYQFMVSMDGYVTKSFTSADLADSSDVLISAVAATPLFISGFVTLPPSDSVAIVSLIIDGKVVGVRTTGQGAFNFEFETDPGASEYLLTAASRHAYNEEIVLELPKDDVEIDLTTDDPEAIQLIVNDSLVYNKTAGIYGSDLLVEITAQDSLGFSITDPQFPNGLVLTLPFNLGQVAPGAFESGDVAVYHAAGQVELLDGDGIIVPVEDVIAVDYIGDGQTGYVTFRVYSLSVFGIGTGSGALSDSSDDSVCFISSVAGGSGMHLPAGVLGLAGLVAGLLHWTGKKSNR